jgi:GAF domain-containing protein/ANTAR domain-containing protein
VGGERRLGLWRMVADRVDGKVADAWPNAACLVCVAVLGVDAAALTLRGDVPSQELLAASDSWAEVLVARQYTVGEGPGVDAFLDGGPVLVADLCAEQARWPGFAGEAMRAGAGAVFAFPLQHGGLRFGVLELFRQRPGGLTPTEVADAALLASLAMDAVLDDADEAHRTGRDWPRPMDSYQDVNMAIGMVAAQLRISLEDALVRLRAYAFATGRSMKDVATEVLARRVPLDELAE